MYNCLLTEIQPIIDIMTLLNYITIAINFVGATFVLFYLIINLFMALSSMKDRNDNLIRVIRGCVISSFLCAILSCVLVETDNIELAIITLNNTLLLIAITWLISMAVSGIAILVLLIFKKRYDCEQLDCIKKIFRIALIATIVALTMTWLFS